MVIKQIQVVKLADIVNDLHYADDILSHIRCTLDVSGGSHCKYFLVDKKSITDTFLYLNQQEQDQILLQEFMDRLSSLDEGVLIDMEVWQ